jgi:hypothetical protein
LFIIKNGEIDWGDMNEVADLGVEAGNPDEVIDYDLDALRAEINVEDTGVYIPSDGIAKGNDSLLLLEWLETRNLLLNDLAKVKTSFFNLSLRYLFKLNNFNS